MIHQRSPIEKEKKLCCLRDPRSKQREHTVRDSILVGCARERDFLELYTLGGSGAPAQHGCCICDHMRGWSGASAKADIL